ncbi:hypothetical protein OROHE_022240 [Orobanche hederae]
MVEREWIYQEGNDDDDDDDDDDDSREYRLCSSIPENVQCATKESRGRVGKPAIGGPGN